MAGRRIAGPARLLAAGLGAGLLLAVLSGPTAQAQAQATLPSVPVPRHDAPTVSLGLVGASSEAVLVNFDDLFDYSEQIRFSGAPGPVTGPPTLLTAPGALARNRAYIYSVPLSVVGDTFGWYGVIGRTSTTPNRYLLHRTNLLTGADVAVEVPLSPIAFTGDAWLAWSGADLVRTTFDGTPTTVLTGASNQLRVVADSTGALVSSLSPDAGTQLRRYRLDLVTFGSGTQAPTVERLADSLDFIGSMGLSGQTAAWLSRSQRVAHPVSINQRARAGGIISTGSESNVYVDDELPLAVGAGRVGYIVADPAGTFLRVQTGGSATATATQVPLPAGGSGIAAVGDRFFTAAGGPTETAGVYAIDGSTPTRVATIPTQQIGVIALAFSSSRLYYADESSPTAAGLTVWQRDVSGRTTPELSAERLFSQRASRLSDIPTRSISISAGRGAVLSPDPARYQWRFFDRGVITGTATQPRPNDDSTSLINDIHPNTSGPYTLVRGKVYRPNGSLIFTRPGEGSIQSAHDDIFGNRLIYSLADFGANTSTIWLRDLAKPKSRTNPLRVARQTCGASCPRRVAIWGDTVAWVHDARHIRVRNLSTGRSRTITTRGTVKELELGEGTLAWQAPSDTTGLLDLTSSTSKPVILGGKATTVTLDDHRFARRVAGIGRVVVYRLPFGGKYRPRLIGTLAPAGFTPNGDGRADTWAPAFDTTKPLTGVTLRIKGLKSGRTLRKLTGTGPDGSIRDLVWDGRSSAGHALRAGTYRWELTARAADGEGTLIPAHAGRTLTGTVRLAH